MPLKTRALKSNSYQPCLVFLLIALLPTTLFTIMFTRLNAPILYSLTSTDPKSEHANVNKQEHKQISGLGWRHERIYASDNERE